MATALEERKDTLQGNGESSVTYPPHHDRPLKEAVERIGNAVSEAETGVQNLEALPENHHHRTRGQKIFDLFLYPILTNTVVFLISVYATYQTNYGKRAVDGQKGHFLRERGDASRAWAKEKLMDTFHMQEDKAVETSKMGIMVLWSFLDGSLMAPVVAWFETKRNAIAKWIDDKLGTTPKDPSVYDKEVKRDWKSILLGRAATFSLVFPTAFALDKVQKDGKSLNQIFFSDVGGKIGDSGFIKKMFPKLSQKSVVNDAGQSLSFTKAIGEISAFELFYTSVCTFGLWVGGLAFGKLFAKHNDEKSSAAPASANIPSHTGADSSTENATLEKDTRSFTAMHQEESSRKTAEEYKRTPPQARSASYVREHETQSATGQPITLH